LDKINCFGDICPVPLLKAIKSIKYIPDGESTMIVTDHSCVTESLSEYFDPLHYVVQIDEVLNGVWEITIHKKLP